MLSRFLDKALERLEIKDSAHQVAAKADELLYPTFSFPSPPSGTRSLCVRCLTLLSHFVTRFGDGTDYQPLSITHSSAIRDLSHAVQINKTTASKNTSECVICVKIFILFNAMLTHGAHTECDFRTSSSTDWSLSWVAELPGHVSNQDLLHVKLKVKYKRGYSWDIGGFILHPEWSALAGNSEQKRNADYVPQIDQLDGSENPVDGQLYLDFSSTISKGTLSIMSAWAKECSTSHPKCNRIFGMDGFNQPEPWSPDRLIQVRRKETGALTARLVLKSNTTNFPVSNPRQLNYLSFSHCWGPPPNPSAPLGGRAGSVLTENNLLKWMTVLPVNDLPLAFRHAITVCAELDFEYIWIDSLCILQDSRKDWETQSAVMGDVYKFAFLNIAALSSVSDYNGFIVSRDTRVTFGFWCSFANILAKSVNELNPAGKPCVLLKGKTQLLWNEMGDIPGTHASNTPLFNRGWVYQEESLARRMLLFANTSVSWSCDGHNICERPGWSGGLDPFNLRRTQHKMMETLTTIYQSGGTEQNLRSLIDDFDKRWCKTVANYTRSSLTKQSDKLIAVSSIARELANTKIIQKRYLAGFWEVRLLSQMSWRAIMREKTSPRKRVGEEGYVAPSWSWASIEAGVNPCLFFPSHSFPTIELADVLGADVELATDYEFGSVKAGWIRLRGFLNRIKSGSGSGKSISLTDELTGGDFWFCSDTVEGHEIVRRGRARSLVWMPLSISFDSTLSSSCLVLVEAEGEQYGGPKGFVRSGERVYRRVGTGNFGRLVNKLRPTDLVLTLGTYHNIQVGVSDEAEIARGFKRKEAGMQEFVLI